MNDGLVQHTAKPVLVATSIKQTTVTEQACNQFPIKENTLAYTCIKQAHFGACLIQAGQNNSGKVHQYTIS